MDSLEKTASFYDKSDNSSGGSDSGEDLKRNPYSSSATGSVKGFEATGIALNNKEPLIKLTDVWKIYQMGEVEFAALKGIDLEIYEGEFLVVLGPSGSGKSTLMNLLGCLDIPSGGTVYLNSEDISKLAESELARIRGQMIRFYFPEFQPHTHIEHGRKRTIASGIPRRRYTDSPEKGCISA